VLLDQLVPAAEADGARHEHRVIEAPIDRVWDAAIHADFIDAVRTNPVVRLLFLVRSWFETLVNGIRRRAYEPPPEPPALRLADLPDRGDWVRLGEDAPHELVFGVVGRFWAGETVWEEIDAARFASFDEPGFAKIGCNLSLREYGPDRTLLSYEARTVATDSAARRSFRRYWVVVAPFVGVIMRSTLRVIDREVGRQPGG
jgi:hypothetical protein